MDLTFQTNVQVERLREPVREAILNHIPDLVYHTPMREATPEKPVKKNTL